VSGFFFPVPHRSPVDRTRDPLSLRAAGPRGRPRLRRRWKTRPRGASRLDLTWRNQNRSARTAKGFTRSQAMYIKPPPTHTPNAMNTSMGAWRTDTIRLGVSIRSHARARSSVGRPVNRRAGSLQRACHRSSRDFARRRFPPSAGGNPFSVTSTGLGLGPVAELTSSSQRPAHDSTRSAIDSYPGAAAAASPGCPDLKLADQEPGLSVASTSSRGRAFDTRQDVGPAGTRKISQPAIVDQAPSNRRAGKAAS